MAAKIILKVYIDFRRHDARGAEVAFLVKRPALHFLAVVFRYVAGDLVRPGHAEAKTVRVADVDLPHLLAVRAAPQDALPDGAQQRIHLPSCDSRMKMQGTPGLFLNDRYIMKLFMLTKFLTKRLPVDRPRARPSKQLPFISNDTNMLQSCSIVSRIPAVDLCKA